MPIREIVHIDEEKCDGCGECVPACAEGAIKIIDGKAKLVGDNLCDGMGMCLGHCPQDAIRIERRDADDFDEAAVEQHLSSAPQPAQELSTMPPPSGGCPGSQMRQFKPAPMTQPNQATASSMQSCLGQWPVQLALVPPHAPFLKGSDLVVCADCVPFAMADFHPRYLAGRAVVVGCPKLDNLQAYYEKMRQMFVEAKPRRITVLKMEVPCCSGIAQAAVMARNQCTPTIPLEVHTIGINSAVEIEVVPEASAEASEGNVA